MKDTELLGIICCLLALVAAAGWAEVYVRRQLAKLDESIIKRQQDQIAQLQNHNQRMFEERESDRDDADWWKNQP